MGETVYMVWTIEWEDRSVWGIYRTIEAAEQRANEVLARDPKETGIRITTYTLDQPTGNESTDDGYDGPTIKIGVYDDRGKES